MPTLVIIGSGLASYTVAKEWRKLNSTDRLIILTSSAGHFYSKPQLSTALTMGKTPEALVIEPLTQMADDLQADIKSNTSVLSIDRAQKKVCCEEEEVFYDQLVLACGAEPFLSPIEGPGVFSVNHLEDYAYFREALREKRHIAIMGAGLVACEFANDLSNSGYSVDLVALSETPLPTLLPEPLGRFFQRTLKEKLPIEWHLSDSISAIREGESDQKKLDLASGKILEADLILSAIGLKPKVNLARQAELLVNAGIVVNDQLQTSDPAIFALGDCAEVQKQVRFYIAPLVHQARVLATVLAGGTARIDYPLMPILVKTPACPAVILPPPKGMSGAWTYPTEQKALWVDEIGQLQGFALVGEAARERAQLLQTIQSRASSQIL